MATIENVGVRELKASLSKVLAMVQRDGAVHVTSHRKPIAKIVSIPALHEPGLQDLIMSGEVSYSGSKPKLWPLERITGATTMSDLILEDRG
jgi:prevent-host-death family protein